MNEIDVCVIGGGAAGMSSALGAVEHGAKKVLLIERDVELGGVLQQCIHNGFGLHYFKEELSGPAYSEKFIDKIKNSEIIVKLETTVLKITKDKTIHYMNKDEGYKVIKAKTIIVSVGCRERSRHQIDLPGSRCAGIYTAGTAQRYVNIDGYLVGKKVFILGSGDIGLIMARRMVLEGADVLGVAELMPYSNGLNRNINQCLKDFDIPLYLSHTVTKVEGKGRLSKITLSEVDKDFNIISNTNKEFEVDTLLLSIGLIPDDEIFSGLDIEINKITNGPVVNDQYETSVKGIFACGNSLHVHDLVDYVSEEGYLAGKYAAKYVKSNENTIEIKALNNVRYVVPNYITKNDDEQMMIKFRVGKPIKKPKIIVKANNEIIKTIKKVQLIPSEMEVITLNKTELLSSTIKDISIEVISGE